MEHAWITMPTFVSQSAHVVVNQLAAEMAIYVAAQPSNVNGVNMQLEGARGSKGPGTGYIIIIMGRSPDWCTCSVANSQTAAATLRPKHWEGQVVFPPTPHSKALGV